MYIDKLEEQINNDRPEIRKKSFKCPFCNIHARHDWGCWIKDFAQLRLDKQIYRSALEYNKTYQERLEYIAEKTKDYLHRYIDKSFTYAKCNNCNKRSIWRVDDDQMIYPAILTASPASKDMPEDVKEFYEEARQIQQFSIKSASALLRIALEKLTIHLGEEKGNLYIRIRNLKDKGVEQEVINTLNIVKIMDNDIENYIGKINLTGQDNKEIVEKLFWLINYIVKKTITEPKQIL